MSLSCVPGEPAKPESSAPLIEELDSEAPPENKQQRKQLCPYAAVGECRYGINCAYLHGDVCDMCGLQVLHPTDNNQRSEHTKVTRWGSALQSRCAVYLLCLRLGYPATSDLLSRQLLAV